MAAKKIEGIEAEMLQFRAELEEQKQDNTRRFKESTKQFQELGSQMEAMLLLLSTVSAAINPALMGETGGSSAGRFDAGSSGGGRREEENAHGDRGGDRTEFRFHKVKMPVFDGDDAYGWIYRAERYFEIKHIRREELVTTAALCMEGAALTWYRWSHRRVPFRSWEELKGRLLDRFQTAHGGDLYEQFLAITQLGTAREYVSIFERMAGQLLNLPEPVLEGTFMKGLKPELRTMLRIMQPVGLMQMMRLAITLEENQGPGKMTGAGGGFVPFNTGGPTAGRGGAPAATKTVGPSSVGEKKDIGNGTARPGQFKRLSRAEMADRRAKGLCFRGDERFTPGHRCTGRALQVLILDEGEDEDAEEEHQLDEEHAHLDRAEVSLNSVVGLTTPHTMKLRGKLGGIPVVALIDSGATHNFLSPQVVALAGLRVQHCRSRGVVLGNGKVEQSKGICTNVVVDFPTFQVMDDFLLLDLGSTDVILGVKWLQTLGDTAVNWKELTMAFGNGSDRVVIKGDPSLSKSQVSAKAICRALRWEGSGFMIEIARLDDQQQVEDPPQMVAALLIQFSDIFQAPTKLPPR